MLLKKLQRTTWVLILFWPSRTLFKSDASLDEDAAQGEGAFFFPSLFLFFFFFLEQETPLEPV